MLKYIALLIVMIAMTAVSTAFGVDPVAVPGESFVDSMIKFLASPTGILVAGGAVEFILRLVKSEKAQGIVHLIGRCLVVFGKGAVALGEFIVKVLGEGVTDKVLPQRLK